MLLIITVYHVKLTCKWGDLSPWHFTARLDYKRRCTERASYLSAVLTLSFLFSFCVGLNGGHLASHLFLLPCLTCSASASHCHFLKTCSSPVKIYKIMRIIPSQAYFIPVYFCSTSLAILKTLIESFFFPQYEKQKGEILHTFHQVQIILNL